MIRLIISDFSAPYLTGLDVTWTCSPLATLLGTSMATDPCLRVPALATPLFIPSDWDFLTPAHTQPNGDQLAFYVHQYMDFGSGADAHLSQISHQA